MPTQKTQRRNTPVLPFAVEFPRDSQAASNSKGEVSVSEIDPRLQASTASVHALEPVPSLQHPPADAMNVPEDQQQSVTIPEHLQPENVPDHQQTINMPEHQQTGSVPEHQQQTGVVCSPIEAQLELPFADSTQPAVKQQQ